MLYLLGILLLILPPHEQHSTRVKQVISTHFLVFHKGETIQLPLLKYISVAPKSVKCTRVPLSLSTPYQLRQLMRYVLLSLTLAACTASKPSFYQDVLARTNHLQQKIELSSSKADCPSLLRNLPSSTATFPTAPSVCHDLLELYSIAHLVTTYDQFDNHFQKTYQEPNRIEKFPLTQSHLTHLYVENLSQVQLELSHLVEIVEDASPQIKNSSAYLMLKREVFARINENRELALDAVLLPIKP